MFSIDKIKQKYTVGLEINANYKINTIFHAEKFIDKNNVNCYMYCVHKMCKIKVTKYVYVAIITHLHLRQNLRRHPNINKSNMV